MTTMRFDAYASGSMTRSALLIPLLALVVTSCDNTSREDRCHDMEQYLDGRELDFERACSVDTDCSIVFVRPGNPIAVNGMPPDDPGLERVIAEYEAQCEPLPRGSGAPFAVCEQRILESADPNDSTQAVFEVLDQVCVVRGTWEVEPVDAGGPTDVEADTEPDAGEGSGTPLECLCASDAECGGDLCINCGCAPAGACADACEAAVACDAVDALQLQTRGDLCVASCEGALERAPETYEAFIDCLTSSPCSSIATCGGLLP